MRNEARIGRDLVILKEDYKRKIESTLESFDAIVERYNVDEVPEMAVWKDFHNTIKNAVANLKLPGRLP